MNVLTINHPTRDWARKFIVALSKDDRSCEIYIREYEKHAFDTNAIQNTRLLKEYLMQGILMFENRRLPYCFDAIAFSDIGEINTTICFKFLYRGDIIMVVANIPLNSNYDCIKDMKIIKDSVRPLSNTEKASLNSEINDEEWTEDEKQLWFKKLSSLQT